MWIPGQSHVPSVGLPQVSISKTERTRGDNMNSPPLNHGPCQVSEQSVIQKFSSLGWGAGHSNGPDAPSETSQEALPAKCLTRSPTLSIACTGREQHASGGNRVGPCGDIVGPSMIWRIHFLDCTISVFCDKAGYPVMGSFHLLATLMGTRHLFLQMFKSNSTIFDLFAHYTPMRHAGSL